MTAWPTARAFAGCFVGRSSAQAVKIVFLNRNSVGLIGLHPCIHYPVAAQECRIITLSGVCCARDERGFCKGDYEGKLRQGSFPRRLRAGRARGKGAPLAASVKLM